MEYDLINKNYAQFLSLPKEQTKERAIFTKQEISLLKQHDSDERARIILTLIYTGFRPNELFSVTLDNVNLTKGYIIGGSKTEAGMNRKVPIHPSIQPYIENWYAKGTSVAKVVSLNRFLIVNQRGGKIDLKNFRSRQFYPLLLELGILELPKGQKAFSKENPPRLTPYCTRPPLPLSPPPQASNPKFCRKLWDTRIIPRPSIIMSISKLTNCKKNLTN